MSIVHDNNVTTMSKTILVLTVVDGYDEIILSAFENAADAVAERDRCQEQETMGRRFYVNRVTLKGHGVN